MLRVILPCLVSAALPAADLMKLVEDGHWKRAGALVDQELASKQNDARFQYLASRVRMAFGNLEEAAKLGERAAELDPKNADYQHNLSEVYGSQAQRASILSKMGLGRKCKKAMDGALALDPKHPEALYVSMMYYYQAPSIIGGDKARARQIPAEIAKTNPAFGAFAEAELASMEKQPEKRLSAFEKAVAANPRFYRGLTALARAYTNAKPPRHDLAEKTARMAMEAEPDRVTGYALLVQTMVMQGRMAEAEKVAAEAEKRIPDNRTCRLVIASVLANQGKDLDKAEKLFRQYLEIEPEPDGTPAWAARWRLAGLLEKSGRKQDAIAELTTAARLKPDSEGIRKDLKRLKG